MNQGDFNTVVEDRIEQIKAILTKKAKEYASDTDRLHNFKKAAGLTGLEPEQCAWLMTVKHLVSVQDMVNSIGGDMPRQEYVDEKIGDTINYMILIDALIRERRDKEQFVNRIAKVICTRCGYPNWPPAGWTSYTCDKCEKTTHQNPINDSLCFSCNMALGPPAKCPYPVNLRYSAETPVKVCDKYEGQRD